MQRALVFLLMTFCTLAHAEIDYFQRPVGARTPPEPEQVLDGPVDGLEPVSLLAPKSTSDTGSWLALDAELGSNYDLELKELGGSVALGLGVSKLPLSPELNLTLLGADLGRESRTAGGEAALKLLLWKSQRLPLSLGVTPKLVFGNQTVFSTSAVASLAAGRLYFKLAGGPRITSSALGYTFSAAAGVSLLKRLSVTALMNGKAATFDESPKYFLGSQLLYEFTNFRVGVLGGLAMPGSEGPSFEFTVGYSI
ncbi:MAG: hypothetical protein JXB05_14945 [Myxococcaceae bacterium]|nr:hypothetical protein [Myxococcaceae bacterium]